MSAYDDHLLSSAERYHGVDDEGYTDQALEDLDCYPRESGHEGPRCPACGNATAYCHCPWADEDDLDDVPF